MDLLDNPLLRRTLAPQPGPDPHAEPRKRLLDALLKMRERAAMLANEIHRDLPDFTVHDITHLDALWEMADLIAGPDYPLNPLEAFALGAVFLLHDLGLGLAAYPGGLAELKKGPGWQDALSTYLRKHLERIPTAEELASPPLEVERMAVQERLRVLHAEQAERLALASWRHGGGPEYHLIDDPDLRQAIGPLLGKIAHSHWWPVSRLGNEFDTVRGALTNCPRDWEVDPLKIAVLLRTSDAAHLDERRAPGFLIALRRPEGLSKEHWRFQNHLLKPRVVDDRLVYTTNRPFPPEEVNDWWLCEETLRMVERELHQVDALLADRGHPRRLRARGVAGVESPHRLQKYVGVSGWTPVDARLHVSNVADLARKLGGEQLYGDNLTVPLRELIQNALDAVRARRILENRHRNWGQVTVRLGRDYQGPWVEVEDTGIGMSEAVLTGPLLDFGTTYWGSELMREENEGLWAKRFEPIGRFGIGFFSVFMWGCQVQVVTRRYDEGLKDTRVMEFKTNLEARPIVRPARQAERLSDSGTRVRVWLNEEPNRRLGRLFYLKGRHTPLSLRALCAWLVPASDVDIYAEDSDGCLCGVAASDWLTLDKFALFGRLGLRPFRGRESICSRLSEVRSSSGKIVGRGAIIAAADLEVNQDGLMAVTVGGLRAKWPRDSDVRWLRERWHRNLDDIFAGILLGEVSSVARDEAFWLADEHSIAMWATEQARYVDSEVRDPLKRFHFGCAVLLCEGDPAGLPVLRRGSDFLGLKEIAKWENIAKEVVFCLDGLVDTHVDVFSSGTKGSGHLRRLLVTALSQAWKCRPEDVEMSHGNYGYLATIFRRRAKNLP